jgi:hypothetical protein
MNIQSKRDRNLIGEPLLLFSEESPFWFWIVLISIFLGVIFLLTRL